MAESQQHDVEPLLSVQPCPCGSDCGGARFTIIHPQINDEGECCATLPGDYITDLVSTLLKIRMDWIQSKGSS